MSRTHATLIGFIAVLLWSLLALFTVGTIPVPPLQLNAMAFSIGGIVGLIWVWRSGGFEQLRRIDWRVYAFGTAGLFGYHVLYFSALRLAPAAEAGLIAYLWPLLIVLFSGLLPGERLRAGHVFGGVISFAGAGLIVTGGAAGFFLNALPGYTMALLCALTWAGYSVFSRRLGQVPTAAVAVFCLASAALSLPLHLIFEETVWPTGLPGWGAILALGLGPVGLAFYVWDIGVKHGDIQMLGVASYAAPLLSTLALVLAGIARPGPALILAALLISTGALIAARTSARARR